MAALGGEVEGDDGPADRVLRAARGKALAAASRAADSVIAALGPAERTALAVDVDGLFVHTARATKRRGGVETRAALVEQLLDLTGWNGRGRVLEPTCGSGAFLAAAGRRARGAELVGVELHPFAARALRVRLALEPAARARVVAGDVLDPALDLGGPFDLIVGNPPWVRGERVPADRRAALRERWDLGQGNVDLAAYVVAACLERLRPGGTLALVLPQGLLDARGAAGFRALLARRTIVAALGLEWAPPCFPGACVIPCVLVVRDAPPPPGHRVQISAPASFPAARWSRVAQGDWLRLGEGRLQVEVRRGDLPLLEALATAPRPLRAGYGVAIRTATDATTLVGDAEAAREFARPRPLIDGREVRPWTIAWAGRYLDDRPDVISAPKSAAFFASPKVVTARIALTLVAAVDDGATEDDDGAPLGPLWARNTVMVVRAPGTPLDRAPHAVVALLQSAPVRLFAHLALRAAALAGSHRATFTSGAWAAVPVPPALLEGGAPLRALERLGRQATRAARDGDAAALACLSLRVDDAVADLFGLDSRVRRWVRLRCAAAPLARILRPPHGRGKAIAVKAWEAGARYR